MLLITIYNVGLPGRGILLLCELRRKRMVVVLSVRSPGNWTNVYVFQCNGSSDSFLGTIVRVSVYIFTLQFSVNPIIYVECYNQMETALFIEAL